MCLQLAIIVIIQDYSSSSLHHIETPKTSAIRAIGAIRQGAGIQHQLSLVLTIRVILNPGDCRGQAQLQTQKYRRTIETTIQMLGSLPCQRKTTSWNEGSIANPQKHVFSMKASYLKIRDVSDSWNTAPPDRSAWVSC